MTNLTKPLDFVKFPFFVYTADECADGIFKSIGQMDEGFGVHAPYSLLFYISEWLLPNYWTNRLSAIFKKSPKKVSKKMIQKDNTWNVVG